MTELDIRVSIWDKNYLELTDHSENIVYIRIDEIEKVCELLRNLAKQSK